MPGSGTMMEGKPMAFCLLWGVEGTIVTLYDVIYHYNLAFCSEW